MDNDDYRVAFSDMKRKVIVRTHRARKALKNKNPVLCRKYLNLAFQEVIDFENIFEAYGHTMTSGLTDDIWNHAARAEKEMLGIN